MLTLTEAEVNDDVGRLHQAWFESQTFAFVPDRSGVPRDWVDEALRQVPNELATGHFALLTSGSTGRPKLIIGARLRSERLVEVLHELQGSDPVREAVLALPLTYSYAFINQWLWSQHHRRRLIMTRGFSEPDTLQAALSQARDAMICLVGVQVPLLARYFEGQQFPGIIRVHFAGGRFPQEKLKSVHGFFPNARIFNNYGCAEAMPRLTLRPAEAADEASDIGWPLPGVELSSNDLGELLFRSPYGAVGFYDAGFSAITPDTWVRTGDLGEPTQRGTWRLRGRAGEVFKRHGEKISLHTLMTTIHHAWPGQAAFYREADPLGEEGCVLVLAPHPGEEQVRAILKALRVEHARSHWPLRVESLPTLPLLPNGKVNLLAIPQLEGRTVHWYQRVQ